MDKIKKIANTRIKKSRIFPTILLTMLVTFLIACIGGMQLVVVLLMLGENQNQNYSTSAELTASYIKECIDETSYDIEQYAGTISSSKIDRSLACNFNDFATFNGYKGVYVVDENGRGYDGDGYSVNLKGVSYFKHSDESKTVVLENDTRGSALIYISPIRKNGRCTGYVIAKVPVVLDAATVINESWNEANMIYILDGENKVIAYNNYGTLDFDYNKIIASPSDRIYREYPGGILSVIAKKGMDNETLDMLSYYNDLDESDFDIDIDDEDGMTIEREEYNVWFQTPLGINDWSVMVRTTQAVNENIKSIILVSGITLSTLLFFQLLIFIIVVCNQISSNRKLITLLYLDPITGGTNWLKFKFDAAKLLRKKKNVSYAMVSFSIDKFNMYNDMHGHMQGNNLLISISQIIGSSVKKRSELATRFSFDQFVMLVAYTDKEKLTERINELAGKLMALSSFGNLNFRFGIYQIEDKSEEVERMANLVAIARDSAKDTAGTTIKFFDNEMHRKLVKEKEIENTMEEALAKKEFAVYLQPKYSTGDEKLSGAEALVRWISESKGFVSPGEFIPIFERNGFVTKLDDYMLNEVCALQKKWIDEGKTPVTISVNISRTHFENPKLAEHIKEIVDNYAIPYSCIELELTESAFFDNKKVLVSTVKALRDYGFSVSMDDFGSGFSSLNSLKDLPLDVIKLDGEFFRDTEDSERSKAIIRDTILLAKNLRMKTVAEGIETREQVDFLGGLGCDLIQGYYFARPMPVEEFERQNGFDMDMPAAAIKERVVAEKENEEKSEEAQQETKTEEIPSVEAEIVSE